MRAASTGSSNPMAISTTPSERFAREPPDTRSALRELEAAGRAGEFAGNPIFDEAVDGLRPAGTTTDRETGFELQLQINELNTIGHVFTRTRKREVQEHFPTRRAHTVRVSLSPAEAEFYNAVTAYVRSQVAGMPSFAVIMPQRQVASSIPAARDYLRDRWMSTVTIEDDSIAEAEIDVTDDIQLEQLTPDERLHRAWRRSEGLTRSSMRSLTRWKRYWRKALRWREKSWCSRSSARRSRCLRGDSLIAPLPGAHSA